MYDVFKEELQIQIAILNEEISNLQQGKSAAEDFKLAPLSLILETGGEILELEPVIRLGKSLKKLSLEVKKGSVLSSSDYLNCLSQVVDELKLLSEAENIPSMLKFRKEEWENLISFITNIEKKNTLNYPEKISLEKPENYSKMPPEKENVENVFELTSPVETQSPYREIKKKEESSSQQALKVKPYLYNLFQVELETQTKSLDNKLIELEINPSNKQILEVLMRSAHSIKGAASIIGIPLIITLAHVIEDLFVAAQQNKIVITSVIIDIILKGIDLLTHLAKIDQNELGFWVNKNSPLINQIIKEISLITTGEENHKIPLEPPPVYEIQKKTHSESESSGKAMPSLFLKKDRKEEDFNKVQEEISKQRSEEGRILRMTANKLNKLMGLAGEALVESSWLKPFADSLFKLKISQNQLSTGIDLLRDYLVAEGAAVQDLAKTAAEGQTFFMEIQHQVNSIRSDFNNRLEELELFIRRYTNLSDRLYREVLSSRMRPFSDATEGFPRFVRDLARQLGKRVILEIKGEDIPVDRDILEKLEAPLNHLLRNAVDHGIETPEERVANGKSPEGIIRLEASHRGGMLLISVTDDGRGLNIEDLRKKIIEDKLAPENIAQNLRDDELIEFIFLPGFSTSETLTEISGRGVGLSVVQNMVHEVGGTIQTKFERRWGMGFYLQLPLTLSVLRALLVQISNEPYAFPLSRIDQILHINKELVSTIENRQYIKHEGQSIGLVSGSQILDFPGELFVKDQLSVIIISNQQNSYGIVVDSFIGEKEIIVQDLDARLGKIANVSGGALMENGDPLLILDIGDVIISIDTILSGGRLAKIHCEADDKQQKITKHILVVDDSSTVREVECRLLQNQGFAVDSAINGIDGLNALRLAKYDLLITDIDMPRMNGIELIRTVKSDPNLKSIPVMVISYKDREEDRTLGMEAGANYYFTKSSFHDESLVNAVIDLIGPP